MSQELGEWIALSAALVWAHTRDSSLFEAALMHEWREITGVYLWMDPETGTNAIEQGLDGWPSLREAISCEKVRARGEPYDQDRVTPGPEPCNISLDLPGPLPFLDGEPFVFSGKRHDLPQLVLIQPQDASLLELVRADLTLRPKDWALHGGKAWRRVEISRSDLAEAFPAYGCEAPRNSNKSHPLSQTELGWKSKILRAVVKELWPDGNLPKLNSQDLVETVLPHFKKALKEHYAKQKLEPAQIEPLVAAETVGYSTITAAARKIRTEAVKAQKSKR